MVSKAQQLKIIRLSYVNELKELFKLGENSSKDTTLQMRFKISYQYLQGIHAEFEKTHFELLRLEAAAEEEVLNAHLEVRSEFLETYFRTKEFYFAIFGDPEDITQKLSIQTESSPARNIKLSKIEVPKFSGDYKKFITYFDTFNSLVHTNSSLSNIEKFNHLISSLSGPPLSLVQCTPLTAENYDIAYQALEKRYLNKRLIANAYFEEIYNAPRITEGRSNSQNLRKLIDTFTENLSALKNMGYPTKEWDFIIVFLLNKCLDVSTVTRFELEGCLDNKTNPSFQSLENFIIKQCNALDAVSNSTQKRTTKKIDDFQPYKPKQASSFVVNTQNSFCSLCNISNHSIYTCSKFLAQSPQQRFDVAKTQKWCLNCLGNKHYARDCTSSSLCKHCRKRHHSLLHFESHLSSQDSNLLNPYSPSSTPNNNKPLSGSSTTAHTLTNFINTNTTVLLSTAIVKAKDNYGNVHNIRVLLDSASQANFITQKCCRRLGLRTFPISFSVRSVGETFSNCTRGASCNIFAGDDNSPRFLLDVVVIPKICGPMPTSQLKLKGLSHISNLKLADPKFDQPGDVDMLIGADTFPLVLGSERITGKENEPIAFHTVFGWILMGKVTNSCSTNINTFFSSCESSIDKTLKRFWELEEVPMKPTLSPGDALCEKIFKSTHFRNETGRFVVALPFKDSEPTFTNSRPSAQKRFLSLERRLTANPRLYEEYSKFMKEYLDLGFMSLVDRPINANTYYIPHHCILRPESTTTPIRVVFDASSKCDEGYSLNDTLLSGPKLQQDIYSILLDFRLHPIVFCTDIKKMFLQILIDEKYRDYQRILWRFSPSESLQDFCLNTVTFGISSSPYLAIRTLLQLAEENSSDFPKAAKLLQNSTYVDDIIGGCASLEEAILTRNELIELLQSGGFELRKWTSNNPLLLKDLPETHLYSQSLAYDLDNDVSIKLLGLRWYPSQDVFSYNVNVLDRPCTKRNILSELARIFDPLGFLTPLTLFAKHLIQYLWSLGLNWDEHPPSDIENKWSRYKAELELLSKLKIPRRIHFDNSICYELHGFADASERGYGCVIYFRVLLKDQSVKVALVCAKSKVSPLKRISIPRLELCAAVLLSDLFESVKKTYKNIMFDRVYAWTDSTVALAWIKSSPHRWKSFVSNRVSHIQEKLAPQYWNHISSENNIADCASRGLLPAELVEHLEWWAGPKFLQCFGEIEPQRVDVNSSSEVTTEEHRLTLNISLNENSFEFLTQRFSSLNKIKRVLAFVQRFIFNCHNPRSRQVGTFSEYDLDSSLLILVQEAQKKHFFNVIINLRQMKPLPKFLRKLNPFLDERGIVRVGGRLKHSQLLYDAKFPILLPSNSRLTTLLISYTHEKHMHPGLQTLQFLLAQRYWILSAKRTIRRILANCYKCWKLNPKPYQPPMGDLPKTRVSQIKAFSFVGTDYAGPFLITLGKSRGAKSFKSYVCLFVCYATKALHIELVSDLTSDAFLAALRRFIARRGRCSKLFSDCGTNFVGANKQIIDLFKNSAQTESIEWFFNPPSAPHFGGLWEAGVKSLKTHLYRVIGEQILTYEEFYTFLVQIEAVLNSRPLCPLSSDPNDLSALTPGHFLTLEPLTCLPDPDMQNIKINRLSRWQLLQRLHQDFWARWHKEYLHTLQQRGKWLEPALNISTGSMVLIKSELLPPLKWHLGRVEKLYPGADGVTRVVDVRTSQGVLKRPLVKLCPLPNIL